MSKLIAIDIGHGSDTYERTGGKGVVVNGVKYEEHDFNSKVGIELDKLLKANGFETMFGQPPNSKEVPLIERTDLYNKLKVDLVWSIHANAGSKNAHGFCSFYWYTAENAHKLAQIFASEVHNAGYETHGDGTHASKPNSWTNLHICRETTSTAVLTENSFMTNDHDFENVFESNQDKFVKDVARIHAKSICEFYGVEFKDIEEKKEDKNEKVIELLNQVIELLKK